MPDNKWESIRDSLVSTVRGRVGDFLKKNADAEKFLLERAERFAKLYADYLVTKSEATKKSLAIVQQSIENELSSVAVNAATETRNIFQAVLGTAIDSLFRVLPSLL